MPRLFGSLEEHRSSVTRRIFVVDGGKANIITAVEARAACEADGQAVGMLLDKHRAALGRQARELVGDRGYGSETALKDCVQRGVQPLLGIRTAHKPPRRHQPRGVHLRPRA